MEICTHHSFTNHNKDYNAGCTSKFFSSSSKNSFAWDDNLTLPSILPTEALALCKRMVLLVFIVFVFVTMGSCSISTSSPSFSAVFHKHLRQAGTKIIGNNVWYMWFMLTFTSKLISVGMGYRVKLTKSKDTGYFMRRATLCSSGVHDKNVSDEAVSTCSGWAIFLPCHLHGFKRGCQNLL